MCWRVSLILKTSIGTLQQQQQERHERCCCCTHMYMMQTVGEQRQNPTPVDQVKYAHLG